MADVVRRPEEGAEEQDKGALFAAGPAAASRALAPGAEPVSPRGSFEAGEARPRLLMTGFTVFWFVM